MYQISFDVYVATPSNLLHDRTVINKTRQLNCSVNSTQLKHVWNNACLSNHHQYGAL